MPFDLSDLLESATAPRMHVDADQVLARGRRRRLRRRLYGAAAATVAVTTIVGTAATALRAESADEALPASTEAHRSPTPGPSSSGTGRCAKFNGVDRHTPPDAVGGAGLPLPTWLDTGSEPQGLDVRVQVHFHCQELVVAVSKGSPGSGSGSVVTQAASAKPDTGFWVVDVRGGGLDRFGKPLPFTSTAIALLPPGQRVCAIGAGPETGIARGTQLALSGTTDVSAGVNWRASFGTMPDMKNPQGATLRICEGTRVVANALRPLNAITELLPEPAGSAVTYSTTGPDGSTTTRDGNGTVTTVVP